MTFKKLLVTTGLLLNTFALTGMTAYAKEDTSQVQETKEEINTEASNKLPYGGNIIIDLDFCTDVDDVCAVRMATALDKLEKINLQGVMLCVTGENNISAMHGLLSHDGYEETPIGVSAYDIPDTSPYWNTLAGYGDVSQATVRESVRLYREMLSNNEDTEKSIIVTTGYVSNIHALMLSEPDDISDKTGKELLEEKVSAIYLTGGSYPEGCDNNFFYTKEARDGLSYLLNNCEVPLIFVTNDNGGPIKCGGEIQSNINYTDDPVRKSLEAWGTSDGRASWDPMAVWIASLSEEDTRTTYDKIDMDFEVETGFNRITEDEDGKYYRIHRLDDNYEWYREQMDKLMLINDLEIEEDTEQIDSEQGIEEVEQKDIAQ